MDTAFLLLSLIVFLPALAALLLAFVPSTAHETLRLITLAATLGVTGLCILAFFGVDETQFQASSDQMQDVFNVGWIPSFNIYYFMGLDGISFPLVMLTAIISALAMGASWSITKY